jgi:two-component system sensor histidine kinase/response regulator
LPIESNTYDSTRARTPLSTARIILVEDNGSGGQCIGDMLKREGLHYNRATAAKQVLALLHSEKPDLILIDMQISGLDGFRMAQAIRREKKFDKIPIIAISAHTRADDREKYFQVGMNDYVSKPIFPDRLFAVLNGWLSSKDRSNPSPDPAAESGGDTARLAKALPGFDVAETVARLGGNIKFYKELLMDFRDNLVAARSALRPLINSGDIEEALIRLHGLKGVCSNLGVIALQQAFQNLEYALATSQAKQYETPIAHIEQTIDQHITTIGNILGADADRDSNSNSDALSPEAADKDLLTETMRRLSYLLDQGRLDATDSFERLKALLHHSGFHREFKSLATAMGCLDYANARKALITLATAMNIVL